MDIKVLAAIGILVITFIVIIKWRSAATYGVIRPSKDVTEAYERFIVDTKLNYFTSGPDAYPNAVIGIDKTWSLETDLWKKRDLNYEIMKGLVLNMRSKELEHNMMLHGFDIFDNRERKIGNWFSIMGLTMTVKITGERKVIVYTPPIDTYRFYG